MIDPRPTWSAIDEIAQANGGLHRISKGAGLSLSTLQRHRRTSWPSLRTVAKILDAYDMTLIEFAKLVDRCEKAG